MTIHEKIEDPKIKESLTKQELNVAVFLINNIDNIAYLTSSKIAQLNYTTTTTVNRMSKKLGFNSFNELKSVTTFEISNQIGRSNKNENSLDDYTFFLPDIDEVKIFASNLIKEQNLIIYGVGFSEVTALYLYRNLLKRGIKVTLIHDSYVLDNIDCSIIYISNSGETTEILRNLNKNNKKIYSITYKNSTLYKKSNYTISHNFGFVEYSSSFHNQQIHLIHIVNYLINEIDQIL